MGLFDDFSGFLTDTVGNNMANNPDDVRKTKRNLKTVGHFKEADIDNTESPILTRKMHDGIKSYQKDRGLKIDGIMRPGGETEWSLYNNKAPKPNKKPVLTVQERKAAILEDKPADFKIVNNPKANGNKPGLSD